MKCRILYLPILLFKMQYVLCNLDERIHAFEDANLHISDCVARFIQIFNASVYILPMHP